MSIDRGVFVDQNIVSLSDLPGWINEVMRTFANVPFHIWAAIMWEESGFKPNAHNTGTARNPEDSVGLFQLNRNGGQGKGFSVAYLMDPVNNARLAYVPIKQAFDRYGDNPALVAVNSGHPGVVPTSDSRVQNIVRTSAFLRGFTNPLEAIGKLLAGVKLPDVGEWIPDGGQIGTGIIGGITGGISSWWSSLRSKGSDAMIDAIAPPAFWFFGINLIAGGVFLAALQSKPAQTVASVASSSGNPQAMAAGAAVQAIGAGNTSGVARVVRERSRAGVRRATALGRAGEASIQASRTTRLKRLRSGSSRP